MDVDTQRGFHLAQGAEMGRAWFKIKSCVVGLAVIVLAIGVVSTVLVVLHAVVR